MLCVACLAVCLCGFGALCTLLLTACIRRAFGFRSSPQMYACSTSLPSHLLFAPNACRKLALQASRYGTARKLQLERGVASCRSSHLCCWGRVGRRVSSSTVAADKNASVYLTPQQSTLSRHYLRLVLEQNTTMNLTGSQMMMFQMMMCNAPLVYSDKLLLQQVLQTRKKLL